MHRLVGSAVAFGVCCSGGLTSALYAGEIQSTEQQTEYFQFPLSPGQAILVFGQFDTMGGTRTLLSVEIIADSTIEAMVTIENDSVLPAPDAAVSFVGQQTLTIPGGDQILTQFPSSTFASPGLDPSDGVSGSGPDFFDFGPLQVMGMSTELLEAGTDDLSTFIGTGTFNASVFAVGAFSATNATDSSVMVSGFMGDGDVTVIYTFTTPIGACCFANGDCIELSASDCETQGGKFLGDDVECAGTDCLQGEIGDTIFADLDGDGLQNDGGVGVPGVTVNLLDQDMNFITSTVTDANGNYFFQDLFCGDYFVEVVPDPDGGFEASPPNVGGNDEIDSDCDETGKAPVSLPEIDSTDFTIDCGLIPPQGQIGNFIFIDTNADGIQNDGDGGIPNVLVNLLDAQDMLFQHTTTDANGMYLFTGIPAGDYTVVVVDNAALDGFVPTVANAGGDDEVDSDCDTNGEAPVSLPNNLSIDLTIDCGFIPPGACCFPDGSCVLLERSACVSQGGEPQDVNGVPCDQVDCPQPGACCLPEGTCRQEDFIAPQGQIDCETDGGVYQGDDTDCADVTCPQPGACCLPEGTCRQESVIAPEGEINCENDGGVYQGDDTLCADVEPCPFGACCLDNESCIETSPSDCLAQGGQPQGNQLCIDVDCATRERGSCNEKGSLLIFSKVEVRWNANGELMQDTFVQLTNDYPDDVQVQMYFINGDEPLDAVVGPLGAELERAHPGWNWVDNLIALTGDQSVYWSVATGAPAGVSPFGSALDPGFPPGRPCPDNPTERCVRGYIIAWAVNNANVQIRWDHLAGDATLVNYTGDYAWQYSACGYQVVDEGVGHGDEVTNNAAPGTLNLNGIDYEQAFDLLLLQFASDGSAGFSGPQDVVTSNGDLTLHPISGDFRQETDGPITTKASFEVWNENEVKFSGLDRCITCWDQTLFENYTNNGPANHLLLENLLTNHGKARIDGLRSDLCDVDFDPNNNIDFPFPPDVDAGDAIDPRDIVSQAAALAGVRAHFLSFDGERNAAAGVNLVGMGFQNATILYDTLNSPPPSDPFSDRTPIKGVDNAINEAFDELLLNISTKMSSGGVIR